MSLGLITLAFENVTYSVGLGSIASSSTSIRTPSCAKGPNALLSYSAETFSSVVPLLPLSIKDPTTFISLVFVTPDSVYINPLNSLRFVLNKLKKDKVNLGKDFYVFTGSTVGVVPILGKGLYIGKIDKLGSAKAIIQ